MAGPDPKSLSETDKIMSSRPLHLIVGDQKVSPCSYDTYSQFKLWLVKTQTKGEVDTYSEGDVSITHWDDQAGDQYPHLLNPCECGTFLPIDVEPGPLLSSAIGLMSDLNRLKGMDGDIPEAFKDLVEAMMQMAEMSLSSNTPLEIR